MTLRIDPDQNEIRALKQMVDWRGKKVLEIGCGNGRLTRRLARLGGQVQAIDPNETLIQMARRQLPQSHSQRVRFDIGKSSRLEYPNGAFDLVLFSWSL
jgi:2-polyprenyl-3-methyl-5-hydroxy-6-metoxy-1,4-benzoquinol methylase